MLDLEQCNVCFVVGVRLCLSELNRFLDLAEHTQYLNYNDSI